MKEERRVQELIQRGLKELQMMKVGSCSFSRALLKAEG